MDTTRLTILELIKTEQKEGRFETFEKFYMPFLLSQIGRHLKEDTDDIVQLVLIELDKRIEPFDHNGNLGAFRYWLARILTSVISKYANARAKEIPKSTSQWLENIQDPKTEAARSWGREHARFLLEAGIKSLAETRQASPRDLAVFRTILLDHLPTDEVMHKFGISKANIFTIKSRIKDKLEILLPELIDDLDFDE